VKVPPRSFFTPVTVSWLVPRPAIWAPIAASTAQTSCTWGSLAALMRVDSPAASTAAITKFSVAVTDM